MWTVGSGGCPGAFAQPHKLVPRARRHSRTPGLRPPIPSNGSGLNSGEALPIRIRHWCLTGSSQFHLSWPAFEPSKFESRLTERRRGEEFSEVPRSPGFSVPFVETDHDNGGATVSRYRLWPLAKRLVDHFTEFCFSLCHCPALHAHRLFPNIVNIVIIVIIRTKLN